MIDVTQHCCAGGLFDVSSAYRIGIAISVEISISVKYFHPCVRCLWDLLRRRHFAALTESVLDARSNGLIVIGGSWSGMEYEPVRGLVVLRSILHMVFVGIMIEVLLNFMLGSMLDLWVDPIYLLDIGWDNGGAISHFQYGNLLRSVVNAK